MGRGVFQMHRNSITAWRHDAFYQNIRFWQLIECVKIGKPALRRYVPGALGIIQHVRPVGKPIEIIGQPFTGTIGQTQVQKVNGRIDIFHFRLQDGFNGILPNIRHFFPFINQV